MELLFQPYEDQHRAQVLGLLLSNTPEYFKPEEIDHLAHDLEHRSRTKCWVVLRAEGVVGYCAMVEEVARSRTTLSWGIVHAAHQGQGIARKMLAYRAAELRSGGERNSEYLVVETIEMMSAIYRDAGFEHVSTWPRGYRTGWDLLEWRLHTRSEGFLRLAAQGEKLRQTSD